MMLKWWQKIWVNFAIFLSYLLLTTPSLNSLLAAIQWVFSLRQFVTVVLLFGKFYKKLSPIDAKSILRLFKVTSENWIIKKKNPENFI
jgi:hypothetical protein